MNSNEPSLEINLGGLRLKNPVTTASGTFGYGQEYDRYFDITQLGAVTTKSITLKPRPGNRPPRLVETPAGLLNAIGLQNVGLETYLREKVPFLREKNVPIIANIYGTNPDEYAELATRLEHAGGADAIEANLSCPNVHDARTARGPVLVSQDCEAVALYTRTIRSATRLPLFIKLTPNVMDIREPALAAQENGADAVCLINTLLGMAIDPIRGKPKLSNVVGGLSGPAIRPIAIKMVWDAAQVLRIPIVGMGGICRAEDALEFFWAGATCVAVGSISFRQPNAAITIIDGIRTFLQQHHYRSIYDIIGKVKVE